MDPAAGSVPVRTGDHDAAGAAFDIEVVLEKHAVGPDTLVMLPAGVPHRRYDAGNVPESTWLCRHLSRSRTSPGAGGCTSA
ncbi:hypothetical protein GCM10023084_67630 [Streptomyces lacrimifluminis]|uniref:Uncharacterized protein n=1 Tax=Streptomyces lacrimifluminis TaxID=1500077 RepID=A0A917L3G7_9ACTN|nr:hypothetical protein GCM10012282_44770 [Streptomyces lacrimifluminis]